MLASFLLSPSPMPSPLGARFPPLSPHLRAPCSIIHASTTTSETVASPPPTPTTATKLNKYSSRITEPKTQGASQAVLYGVGLSDDDLHKAQVGISSVWYEGNTCNMHLLKLSEAVKEGVEEAGMVGFGFYSVGVSDAIYIYGDQMDVLQFAIKRWGN